MNAKPKLGRGFYDISHYQKSMLDYSAPDLGTRAVPCLPEEPARKIGIASGKGGTGKSVLACNLSLCLTKLGKRVLLMDADFGLANDHIILGMSPEYHIAHLLEERKNINDILLETTGGLKFLPGSSGIEWIADLSDRNLYRMMAHLEEAERSSDLLFIDTAAGISRPTLLLLLACDDIILITTKNGPAMMDAYALSKIIFRLRSAINVWIVVNRVKRKAEAMTVFDKMNGVAQKFLGRSFRFLGYLKESELVEESINEKIPFFIKEPCSLLSSSIQTMGEKITANGFFSKRNEDRDYLHRRITKIMAAGLIE